MAVKVLHRRASDLEREARIGGLLRHRHLVDVYEVGCDDGRWFCAMELCEGSLADRVPLSPRAVVEVGLAVAAVLQYAHEELGLVHLDLKPRNLLYKDGVVKVADLGIALARGFASEGVRGTPGYMSPEQARGDLVDARADVYALGVTLVELATGARGAASETVSLDEDVAVDRPAVPEWLAPIVDRCLETHPEDRWQGMAEVAVALRALRCDGPSLGEILGSAGPVSRPDGFVGREQELAELAGRLRRPGVVWMHGGVGVGKSRLAIEALRRYDAGRTWVVDLTEAREERDAIRSVADALRVPLGRGDPTVQLGHALAARGDGVVLLDNADRVDAALRGALASWHRAAPRLRWLVTARAVTEVAAERMEVGPLSAVDARALLVERAARRGVDAVGHPRLGELADRLERLPLALELAAGRLGVLSVDDVLDRLGLGLLRSGADDRHATLRAAFDWGWELLSVDEQAALPQLVVFAGGCSFEAARGVVRGVAEVDDVLRSLVDRAWARATDDRVRLPESVRAYVADRHADPDAELRHGRYFAAFGAGDEAVLSPQLLKVDLENLVVACRRAVARRDGPVAAGTLRAAWAVLDLTGPDGLAAELCDAVLGLDELAPSDRAAVSAVAAVVRRRQGLFDVSEGHIGRALALYRAAGDRRGEGLALGERGYLLVESMRMDEGREVLQQALAIHREAGNRRAEGNLLGNLAVMYHDTGDLVRAREHHLAAIRAHQETGHARNEGVVFGNLGILAFEEGRFEEALAHQTRALALNRAVGNRRSEGVALGYLGKLHEEHGELDLARLRLEESLAIHREVGNVRFAANVLASLGSVAMRRDDVAEARRRFEEGHAILADLGDLRATGHLLGLLAHAVAKLGGWDEARGHLDRAEVLLRSAGDQALLTVHLCLRAELHWRYGDPPEARAAFAEAEALGGGTALTQKALATVRALLASPPPGDREGIAR